MGVAVFVVAVAVLILVVTPRTDRMAGAGKPIGEMLEPLKQIDRDRYRAGLPHILDV